MLQPTYLIFKSAAAPQLLVVVGSVLTFSGSSLSNSLGYALSRRNLHSNTKIHIASEPTYYSSKARGKIDKSKRKNTKYFCSRTENFIDFILSCSSAVRSSFSFTCKWNDLKKYALPWKMPCSYGIE